MPPSSFTTLSPPVMVTATRWIGSSLNSPRRAGYPVRRSPGSHPCLTHPSGDPRPRRWPGRRADGKPFQMPDMVEPGSGISMTQRACSPPPAQVQPTTYAEVIAGPPPAGTGVHVARWPADQIRGEPWSTLSTNWHSYRWRRPAGQAAAPLQEPARSGDTPTPGPFTRSQASPRSISR